MHLKANRALLLLIAIVAARGATSAERVQDLPRPTNYVSDLAGVLSAENKQALNQYCSEVDHQAHAQIAVVTVKSLDGEEIPDYAVSLYDAWKIGAKGTDRGVLILLATADRKRSIKVGYGLEGILPDGKVGDIGRTMVPALRAGNYDQAVGLAVSQIGQVIAADAGVTLQQPMTQRGPPRQQPAGVPFGRLIFFGIVFLVLIVFLSRAGGGGLLGFLLGMFFGGGGRGGWGGGGFGGGDGGGSGGGGGDGGFGGFGGGSTGGGGADGSW